MVGKCLNAPREKARLITADMPTYVGPCGSLPGRGRLALIEVFYHADVFLEHLLRLENDVAAVGGDIDLVDCERVEVVEIVEKRDSLGGTGQS